MKKILSILLGFLPLTGYAQFDEQFYRPEKTWQAHRLPPYEEVWVANGTDSLHAVWCRPAEEADAVVFFCHGNAGNISYNDGIVAPLVEGGFAVFAWDYPGFGRSTGTPTHSAIAAAGERALEALLAREEVQGKKVIVFGYSIGCQIAAKLARDNRDRVSALVLDAGMKSFTEMALLFSPAEAHPMIRQYVVSPYAAIEDVQRLDGLPKLIAHSPEDRIAPFAHGQALYQAAADPKLFLEYPGGHNLSALVPKREETLALLRRLIE